MTLAVRRFEQFSGRDAVLEATGQTFADVQAERRCSDRVSAATTSVPKRTSKKTSKKAAR